MPQRRQGQRGCQTACTAKGVIESVGQTSSAAVSAKRAPAPLGARRCWWRDATLTRRRGRLAGTPALLPTDL